MPVDGELLGRYTKGRDEAAFAELVRRHLPMIYSAALPQVAGDTHLAEDVCQAVFSDLARKAAQLARHTSVAGWLYTSARFAANKSARTESRRRHREGAAFTMNQESSDLPWAELRELLDAAMNELGEKDREAIVLRFFESRDLAMVGAALGTTANAARMRVDRALERLRGVLEKRGVTATSAALAAALAGASAEAVPTSLVSNVAAAAAATAPATGGGGVVMFAVAASVTVALAVILWHALSPSATELSARPLATANAAKTKDVSAAMELHPPQGDPFQLQKMAQRHDAQVRAHRGATNDWFSRQMRAEPGVKKYGAQFRARVAPGDALVCGGWTVAAGTRLLYFITPVMDTNGPDQVDISSRTVEVPETNFDNPQIRGFRNVETDATVVEQMPDEVDRLIKSLNVEVEGAPGVTTLLGREARVATRDQPEGQGAYFGNQMDFNATRATDGASINLDFAVVYAQPDSYLPSE